MDGSEAANLELSVDKGASQAANFGNSAGQTSNQNMYLGRFFSPPMAAQTIGGSSGSFKLNISNQESNLSMNFGVTLRVHISVWRPSTNSFLGAGPSADYANFLSVSTGAAEPNSASAQRSNEGTATFTPNSFTVESGDRLCVEVIQTFSQSMSSSYEGRWQYNGTTETAGTNNAVTNHASFIEIPDTISWQGAGITANASITFENSTVSSGASVSVAADLSKTLDNSTVSSDSSVLVTADLSVVFENTTLSSDASPESIHADVNVTFADTTVSSDASVSVVASASVQLADTTSSSDASVLVTADAAPAASDTTSSSDASVLVQAESSIALDDTTVSSTATVGAQGIVADASIVFEDTTISSSAGVLVAAASSIVFDDSTVSSGSSVAVGASSGISLQDTVVSSDASVLVTAQASITFSDTTVSSTAGEEINLMGLEAFVSDYTGTTNDRLKQLLMANGATEGAINDMWMQFFDGLGFTSGTVEDRMRAFLLDYTAVADTGQTIPDLWALVDGPYQSGVDPLLDVYGSGAIRAFSTRQLKSSGGITTVMQVMRAADSATQDFGFVDGVIDTAGIATFLGADSGKVNFWYDQSGASSEAYTPTFASTVGYIYTTGSQEVMNTKPAVRSLSNSAYKTVTEVAVSALFVVFKCSTSPVSSYDELVFNSTSSIIVFSGGTGAGRTGPGILDGANMVAYVGEDTNAHILSVLTSGGTNSVYLDGALVGTYAGGTFNLRDAMGMTGHICEIIMYNTDQTSNRAGIEANMSAYWGL